MGVRTINEGVAMFDVRNMFVCVCWGEVMFPSVLEECVCVGVSVLWL